MNVEADKKSGKHVEIVNFRSIDHLKLSNIPKFAVFAGANGSGKSNLFDAIYFASLIVRFDAQEALKLYGSKENTRCFRRKETDPLFQFAISLSEQNLDFSLVLKTEEIQGVTQAHSFLNGQSFDEMKEMSEKQHSELSQSVIDLANLSKNFKPDRPEMLRDIFKKLEDTESIAIRNYQTSKQYETLLNHIVSFCKTVRLYRIDPNRNKASQAVALPSSHDDSELESSGANLAVVLRRLESDEDKRETIVDWLQCVVPEMDLVEAKEDRLTGVFQLEFKEAGTDQVFPAHLVSEGTIYLLCLLVAVLDRPEVGLTLIEEPERGLHPKAIIQLIQALRELATDENPIWLTTHSETVVRMLKDDELWLVDKVDGKTQIKQVTDASKLQMGLDEAWLCNVLDGGLPW